MRRGMFDEDMRAVSREVGEDVTIGGRTVKAVVGEIDEAVALELSGYLPNTTASFTFRLADLAAVPKAQDRLVHDGIAYRVLVPSKTPHGGAVVVNCGAESA
jgi:hypothetical protein